MIRWSFSALGGSMSLRRYRIRIWRNRTGTWTIVRRSVVLDLHVTLHRSCQYPIVRRFLCWKCYGLRALWLRLHLQDARWNRVTTERSGIYFKWITVLKRSEIFTRRESNHTYVFAVGKKININICKHCQCFNLGFMECLVYLYKAYEELHVWLYLGDVPWDKLL